MGAVSVVSRRIGWPGGSACSRPTCAGTGAPGYEPPWNLATHVDDVLETVEAAGVERAAWVGHSFGARLVLELCARAPERVERAVLLDPAIQLLPHVGRDFAEASAKDQRFATAEEAIDARLDDGDLDAARVRRGGGARAPRARRRTARFRWRYSRAAVVTAYSELCTDPPPPTVLPAPALLVHASSSASSATTSSPTTRERLGDRLEVVGVPGGHVVYWDAYEETADAVEKFLNRDRAVTHA